MGVNPPVLRLVAAGRPVFDLAHAAQAMAAAERAGRSGKVLLRGA